MWKVWTQGSLVSSLSMIVRVNVVLNRSCWQWLTFRQHQRLSGSHIQSQTALSIQQNWIPVGNFGNSMCPMERYIPVAHTRPKPQRVCLLFLQAGYKRAVLGTTILSNGKGHFGPTDRNDQTGQSGPPSKLVPNIPVGPNLIGQWSRDVIGHLSVKSWC